MQIVEKLLEVINEKNLLKHKFYVAWSQGELSKESLQRYAAQYYHQVKTFPRFISRVHTHCPHIKARQSLIDNLMDEEKKGKDHPSLWIQFADGLGVDEQEVHNETPYVKTQQMVDTYYKLAERDWRDGLCALYAYEYQVPEVSKSKIDGLQKFYGISDEKTLEFFKVHQIYDVEHSDEVAKLIEEYGEENSAIKATAEACDALWNFLDGVCEELKICC